MLIIPVKEGENIDRALKRFKRKFEKTGAAELRRGTFFSFFFTALLTVYLVYPLKPSSTTPSKPTMSPHNAVGQTEI